MRLPGSGKQRCRFAYNPRIKFESSILPALVDVMRFHQSIPEYAVTPLYSLPGLAAELGVGRLLLKDESRRFGLNAFKVLGVVYAVRKLFMNKLAAAGYGGRRELSLEQIRDLSIPPHTLAAATDGNHGRAVAWTARKIGRKAVIFVPANTSRARIEAIQSEGATVEVVQGVYDHAVIRAEAESQANGWQIISDTAYPGCMEIPGWIMDGYLTLFAETHEQMRGLGVERPDAVFLQAGVGGFASSGVTYFRSQFQPPPRFIAVEPLDSDCLLASFASADGRPRPARGSIDSIMAGLNAGFPSLLAWPSLKASIDLFLAIEDDLGVEAVRRLYAPLSADPSITAGESGAAGLAGLMAFLQRPELSEIRSLLGSNKSWTVLIVNTEGSTDPESFQRIVSGGAAPSGR